MFDTSCKKSPTVGKNEIFASYHSGSDIVRKGHKPEMSNFSVSIVKCHCR